MKNKARVFKRILLVTVGSIVFALSFVLLLPAAAKSVLREPLVRSSGLWSPGVEKAYSLLAWEQSDNPIVTSTKWLWERPVDVLSEVAGEGAARRQFESRPVLRAFATSGAVLGGVSDALDGDSVISS
jgi:hypothetical protein